MAVYRVGKAGILVPVVDGTLVVTAMIFAMLIGASLFSLVFHELGGADRVEAFPECSAWRRDGGIVLRAGGDLPDGVLSRFCRDLRHRVCRWSCRSSWSWEWTRFGCR